MAAIYLVTGAAGHLGHNVVRELLARGQRVRALVLPGDRTAARLPSGVEICRGDVLQQADLARFCATPPGAETFVIHCAGIVTTYWRFAQHVYNVNVQGTRNIVEQCLAAQVKRLVYVSSVHAIPTLPIGQTMTEVTAFDPDKVIGFYGKTKAAASQIVLDAVQARGLDAVLVFPAGLCGPHDYANGHVTQMLIDSASGRLPAGVRGGYDFVDVRDVAQAVVAACTQGACGAGYILGNRWISVQTILHHVHTQTGVPEVKRMLPIWLARLLVPLLGVYYRASKRPPVFTRYSLYTLTSNANFTSARARAALGFHTRPFAETIADTLAWLQSEGRLPPRTRWAGGGARLAPR